VFAGLATPPLAPPADRTVELEVACHLQPSLHWSVLRDGRPCEMELRDDAVLVHLQWELNRLAIESSPTAIHAAAVALGGGAVLLAGQSYSGKTTLAGWLAAHAGAAYLGDEVAAIDHQMRVRPYPRPLGLRPSGPLAADLPAGDELARRFMPDERLVPVAELGGTVATEPVGVRLIVFPRYESTSQVTARRLDQADTFERLAALTPGLALHGRPVFERLTQLVVGATAIDLHYDDVRAAAEILLEHVSAAGVP
jgi:hypothetical protein